MLKLVRLELKKVGLGSFHKAAAIASLGISALMLLIYYVEELENAAIFANYEEALFVIDTFVRATFIILASVLLSKLFINEYRNKTISLMFTYPINRMRLLVSKLLIVFIFTFFWVMAANVTVSLIFIGFDIYRSYIPGELTTGILYRHSISMIVNAAAAAGMSLIPLYFGMRRKSVSTTVVSSILIVALVCSNNGGFSLSSIVAVPLTLAAVGITVAYLSIRNVEQTDLL